LVEQRIRNAKVVGSTPIIGTIKEKSFKINNQHLKSRISLIDKNRFILPHSGLADDEISRRRVSQPQLYGRYCPKARSSSRLAMVIPPPIQFPPG
jgi:hypothetical protein